MAGLNKLMIIGNVGTDPEMRYTASGDAMTTFAAARGKPPTASGGSATRWSPIGCSSWIERRVCRCLRRGRRKRRRPKRRRPRRYPLSRRV